MDKEYNIPVLVVLWNACLIILVYLSSVPDYRLHSDTDKGLEPALEDIVSLNQSVNSSSSLGPDK